LTKFLIIDDDAVFRAWLRGLLQRHFACSVSEAVNGIAAWSLLTGADATSSEVDHGTTKQSTGNRETFDLCFIDAMMPGMDGPTLLGKIRGDERLRTTKVIFCSASGNRNIVVQVAVHRVDGYLVKPLDGHTLVGLVRKCVPGISGTGLRAELDEMCTRLDLKKEVCLRSIGELISQAQKGLTQMRSSLVAREYGTALAVSRELALASDRIGLQALSKPLDRLVKLLEELSQNSRTEPIHHSQNNPFPQSYEMILEAMDRVGLENARLLSDFEVIVKEQNISPATVSAANVA
jgi:CheY-like chemotaxis protein